MKTTKKFLLATAIAGILAVGNGFAMNNNNTDSATEKNSKEKKEENKPSFYEQHKTAIWAGAGALAALMVMGGYLGFRYDLYNKLFGKKTRTAKAKASANIYYLDSFYDIAYKKNIRKLPVDVKRAVDGASQKSINKSADTCFFWLNKDNYPASKLLLQELLKRKQNLKIRYWTLRKLRKNFRNPAKVLLDIDPHFFDHVQNYGFTDMNNFTKLTKISRPKTWKQFFVSCATLGLC